MRGAATDNVAEVVHRAEVDGGAVVGLVHRLKDQTVSSSRCHVNVVFLLPYLSFGDPLQDVVGEHLKVHLQVHQWKHSAPHLMG